MTEQQENKPLPSIRALIATPCYDCKLHLDYLASFERTAQVCMERGVLLGKYWPGGDSLVTRARGDCVANFLANETWTHLVFIDSDIVWAPEAFLSLVQSPYDVAGVVYRKKSDEVGWPANIVADMTSSLSNRGIDQHGFLEADELPTGFLSITRSALLKLQHHYPELKVLYGNTGDVEAQCNKHGWAFFDTLIVNHEEGKRYLSEDYAFCKLWRDVGGKCYVNPFHSLGHIGMKVYAGALAESLQLEKAPEPPIAHTIAENLAQGMTAKITIQGVEHHVKPAKAPEGQVAAALVKLGATLQTVKVEVAGDYRTVVDRLLAGIV